MPNERMLFLQERFLSLHSEQLAVEVLLGFYESQQLIGSVFASQESTIVLELLDRKKHEAKNDIICLLAVLAKSLWLFANDGAFYRGPLN